MSLRMLVNVGWQLTWSDLTRRWPFGGGCEVVLMDEWLDDDNQRVKA